MTRPLALVLALAVLSGCEHEDEHVPNWLFRGVWIDVDGWDREADETCAGTFSYLDAYAGVLAAEFGVDHHLSVYRWYSVDAYWSDKPCGENADGCAWEGDGADSFRIPHEHEVVHMADFAVAGCPSILAEGLAEYFNTHGRDVKAEDFDLLEARLADPIKMPYGEYPVAGRFAGYLVHEFGLPTVLEACAAIGRFPDAEHLAKVMSQTFGASPEQLVAAVAAEPDECNSFERYQSRIFACGDTAAAPFAGVVAAEFEFVASYVFDCDADSSVGPWTDEIRIIQQIEFVEGDFYHVRLDDSDGDPSTFPPLTLVLASCDYCGEVEGFRNDNFAETLEVGAGRHWLELRAPVGFRDTIQLRISHFGG